MKKWMLICAMLGLPVVAAANPYGSGQGGMGGGMQGGGMQGNMGGGMHPPGPPPEFFTACQGKKEGAAVTVNGPRGQMQGTCRLMFAPSQQPGQQGQGGQGQGSMGQGSMSGGQGGMGQRRPQ